MKKITISILSAAAILGLVLTGAEAVTFKMQLITSTAGFCIFAMSLYALVWVIRRG